MKICQLFTLFSACLLLWACSSSHAETDSHPLNDVAIPLQGPDTLTPLIEQAGATSLVLLGEASHGTSEYYTWRSTISRRLIEEHGFRLIVVEGDWVSSYRLNRYIRGELENTSAREILAGFTRWPVWMWANEETAELIEWLREYNHERPEGEQVGFYGMDVYGAEEALTELPALLAPLAPKLKREVRRYYRCLDGGFNLYVNRLQQGQRSCQQAVARAVKALQDSKKLQIPPRDYLNLLQTAKVVQNSEAHYRAMLQRGPDSWNIRVDHFHNTVERLREFYGENNKAIVWAHNTHIGDARATAMAAQGQRNIGQLARQSLGHSEVFALGFSTYYGEVMAGSRWDATPEIMTIPKARQDSLEAHLAGHDNKEFLLLFNNEDKYPSLRQPIGHRAIGVVYNPAMDHQNNYVPSLIMQRYNGLIFIEKTHALTPITK